MTLTTLNSGVTEDCLSGFVFSGPGGSTLTSAFGVSDEEPADEVTCSDDIDVCLSLDLSLIHI